MPRTITLLLLAAAAASHADDVLLRGGGRVHGVVVEHTADRIVIEAAPGRVTLPASRVERVISRASDLATFEERAAKLGTSDASGWLDLGYWARERGLATQAQAAFSRVLAVDPDNAPAHDALGHVMLAGRWLTREESYAARGLVEFEGAWVTPEQRTAMLRARAEEALAERALAEASARAREAEARARIAEAEARRAEAEAAAAAAPASGIPLPWAYSGGYGIVTAYGGSGYRPGWSPGYRGADRGGDRAGHRRGEATHGGQPAPRTRPSSINGQTAARPRPSGSSSIR